MGELNQPIGPRQPNRPDDLKQVQQRIEHWGEAIEHCGEAGRLYADELMQSLADRLLTLTLKRGKNWLTNKPIEV